MSNYVSGGQKRDKAAAKRERSLMGAIKRGESEGRLLVLAEKLREAKLQACRARRSEHSTSTEKWQSITPQEILKKYRRKCERRAAADAEDAAAEP